MSRQCIHCAFFYSQASCTHTPFLALNTPGIKLKFYCFTLLFWAVFMTFQPDLKNLSVDLSVLMTRTWTSDVLRCMRASGAGFGSFFCRLADIALLHLFLSWFSGPPDYPHRHAQEDEEEQEDAQEAAGTVAGCQLAKSTLLDCLEPAACVPGVCALPHNNGLLCAVKGYAVGLQ